MREFTLILILIAFLTSAYKEVPEKLIGGIYTQQPCFTEFENNSIAQTQYSLTLKFGQDFNLYNSKVGQKLLFVLPSDVKLQNGQNIPKGTKFSGKIINKTKLKNPTRIYVRMIVNKIIFTDGNEYLLITQNKKVKKLDTINIENILGKKAKIDGIMHLNTTLINVKTNDNKFKFQAEEDAPTSVGFIFTGKTSLVKQSIKIGTPIIFEFNNKISPEVQDIK